MSNINGNWKKKTFLHLPSSLSNVKSRLHFLSGDKHCLYFTECCLQISKIRINPGERGRNSNWNPVGCHSCVTVEWVDGFWYNETISYLNLIAPEWSLLKSSSTTLSMQFFRFSSLDKVQFSQVKRERERGFRCTFKLFLSWFDKPFDKSTDIFIPDHEERG